MCYNSQLSNAAQSFTVHIFLTRLHPPPPLILKSNSYRKTFEEKVSEAAKDEVDFSKPLFTGAALYTICK